MYSRAGAAERYKADHTSLISSLMVCTVLFHGLCLAASGTRGGMETSPDFRDGEVLQFGKNGHNYIDMDYLMKSYCCPEARIGLCDQLSPVP